MRRSTILFIALFLVPLISKASPPTWEIQAVTDTQGLSVTLRCAVAPTIGELQTCAFIIKHPKKLPAHATLSIDGGMPAHGHGLPTLPIITTGQNAGHYIIEGLKFSMSGEWVLACIINSDAQKPDIATFTFDLTY